MSASMRAVREEWGPYTDYLRFEEVDDLDAILTHIFDCVQITYRSDDLSPDAGVDCYWSDGRALLAALTDVSAPELVERVYQRDTEEGEEAPYWLSGSATREDVLAFVEYFLSMVVTWKPWVDSTGQLFVSIDY